jgi:hypothetical protein
MIKYTGADSDGPALFLRICNSVSTQMRPTAISRGGERGKWHPKGLGFHNPESYISIYQRFAFCECGGRFALIPL